MAHVGQDVANIFATQQVISSIEDICRNTASDEDKLSSRISQMLELEEGGMAGGHIKKKNEGVVGG